MNSTVPRSQFVTIRRTLADGSTFTYTGPAEYIGRFAGHVGEAAAIAHAPKGA